MEFQLVDERDVPPKPKGMSKNARASLDLIEQLTPGKVAKVKPRDSAAIRGLKLSLARVASLNGHKIQVWDDQTYVYAKLV